MRNYNGYKIWLYKDSQKRELKTWRNYEYNQSQFYQDKKNNKLTYITTLQPNQRECELDSIGIYRYIYGKRNYIYRFK